MNKITQNKFLMGMVALFVVAAAGFGILVYPAWDRAGKSSAKLKTDAKKISDEIAELPGEPNVEEWQAHAKAMKERYQGRLAELATLDQSLGQWFDELDDNSTFAAFMNKYDDEKGKLEAELLAKGVLLGSPRMEENKEVEGRTPGFNWILRADVTRATTHEQENQAKEILQKRFNISRVIMNAVTAGVDPKAPRPRRLLDVTFLEKFPFASQSLTPSEGRGVLTIPIDHKRYVGWSGPTAGLQEALLPKNGYTAAAGADAPSGSSIPLGRTITFGFALQMEYTHVPDLIRNLIQPPVPPTLNMSVIGVNIFVPEPNKEVVVDIINVKEGEDRAPYEAEAAKKSADCPPPLVHVYITCQVLDLDPAAVPDYLRP